MIHFDPSLLSFRTKKRRKFVLGSIFLDGITWHNICYILSKDNKKYNLAIFTICSNIN